MTVIGTHVEHKEIKNTNSTVRWLETGIVHIEWNHKTDIDVPDVIELENSFKELTGGELVCVVQDVGNYTDLNTEARKYAATVAPKLKGIGYIIHGLGQRLVLGFYLKLRVNKSPTKVFSSVEDAASWLRTL